MLFGDWPVLAQLKCEVKTTGYAGKCFLISKALYFIPMSTPLGQVLDADVERSSRSGKFVTYYQIALQLDSDRQQFLPIFLRSHENASITAAYINQYITGGINPTFDIEDIESNVFTQALTLLIFLFGVYVLLIRNGTIAFDKNQNELHIQRSSIFPSIKKYPLADISKVLVDEKMTDLLSELEKRYRLVLVFKGNEVLQLPDTVSPVKSELDSMAEQINKFLQLS